MIDYPKCGDCKNFERLKFHKSVCLNESEQKGGNCIPLKEALEISNFSVYSAGHIHVYEGFGCKFHEARG